MRRLMIGLAALVATGVCGGFAVGAVTRPAAPAEAPAGSLAEIAVVRSGPQAPVDVSTPTAVSSAELVVSVPDGKQDLFDVRFSGVVAYPEGANFPVTVDVTVNGIAMPPSELPAWSSDATSPIPFQIERALGPLDLRHVSHRNRAHGNQRDRPPTAATARLDARVAANERVRAARQRRRLRDGTRGAVWYAPPSAGPLAQGESTSLTRKGSQVQILHGPPVDVQVRHPERGA